MARLARLSVAGYPHHVIQRGNNRQAIFLDETDYERMLQLLREASARHRVGLHAWVLLPGQMQLLATPQDADGLPRMMQDVGRAYVRTFNNRHLRSGTLWEGRYKSCLVDSDGYFLACSRYIELNPVRAWIAADPADYRWSSHRANASGAYAPFLNPHACYLALGPDSASRATAYRNLFDERLPDDLVGEIRCYLRQQRALGSDRFRAWVEARTGRFATARPPGRPPQRSNCP